MPLWLLPKFKFVRDALYASYARTKEFLYFCLVLKATQYRCMIKIGSGNRFLLAIPSRYCRKVNVECMCGNAAVVHVDHAVGPGC